MTAELLATCWTHAGDVRPLDDPEVSPLPIERRVPAVAAGGWAGIGFAQGDLEAADRTIGAWRRCRNRIARHTWRKASAAPTTRPSRS
jgi:hypothetical protein